MGVGLAQLVRYLLFPVVILLTQRRWPGLGELYRSNPLERAAFAAMDRKDPLPRYWGSTPGS
jgi:hypothetical protein